MVPVPATAAIAAAAVTAAAAAAAAASKAADRCPRCGAEFHCGAHDPTPCACTTLRLDAATLAALRAEFTTCLCLACLAQLAATPGLALAQGVSASPNAR